MGHIGAALLQDVWERGLSQHPLERAITLLQADDPGASPGQLAGLTIGERDRRLLSMRERLVGHTFESEAWCPVCAERVELRFEASDVRTTGPVAEGDSIAFEYAGYRVRARLPNSLDLLDAAQTDSAADRPWRLFRRCLDSVTRDGVEVEAETILGLAAATGSQLAEADAMTDVQILLECPQCEHSWTEQFDIAAYLWREVDDRARRLLQDVHVLALHYGWCESEILALSDLRRQFYLRMVLDQ